MGRSRVMSVMVTHSSLSVRRCHDPLFLQLHVLEVQERPLMLRLKRKRRSS